MLKSESLSDSVTASLRSIGSVALSGSVDSVGGSVDSVGGSAGSIILTSSTTTLETSSSFSMKFASTAHFGVSGEGSQKIGSPLIRCKRLNFLPDFLDNLDNRLSNFVIRSFKSIKIINKMY